MEVGKVNIVMVNIGFCFRWGVGMMSLKNCFSTKMKLVGLPRKEALTEKRSTNCVFILS